jgi:hypothetical protein
VSLILATYFLNCAIGIGAIVKAAEMIFLAISPKFEEQLRKLKTFKILVS